MLESAKMMGFLITKDYDASRAFYEGKLGLEFVSVDQFAMVMRVGGHMVRISKLAEFTPQRFTVLGWEVPDVSAAVTWLEQQGVAMEKYPWVQDQEHGIWSTPDGSKVAWFKDPDGNVLSVSQHASN